MSDVRIFRGEGNKWTSSLEKYLRSKGHRVSYAKKVKNLSGASSVVIWNGELKGDREAWRFCRREGIPYCFIELGFFSQQDKLILSREGSVGGRLFQGEMIQKNTQKDEEFLQTFFCGYSCGKKRSQGDHVIAMLQVEDDTSIQNHSPFKKMQGFVDYVEACFPNDEVRFKAHPHQLGIKLRTRIPVVREKGLWDHLLTAKLCVGINSTSLYEAVLAGVPVIALGSCPLNRHPNRHRDIVREIIRRQIPLNFTSEWDWKVVRSIGWRF